MPKLEISRLNGMSIIAKTHTHTHTYTHTHTQRDLENWEFEFYLYKQGKNSSNKSLASIRKKWLNLVKNKTK